MGFAKKNGGVHVPYYDFVQVTHTNQTTKQLQDGIDIDLVEKVCRKKEERLTQLSQQGTPVEGLPREEVDTIVLEYTPKRKGRLFGLGCLPEIYKAGCSWENSPTDREIVLEQEVAELKTRRNAKDGEFEKMKEFISRKFLEEF
ncbi:unnamed protein product [Thlaspi arvense]|uniref:Uncharacterized protein n=1 Tax=Thlaspi arvense TaxID=13288 RepID=A0AAU9SD25_THLAR|nr:unnamed protein product [Thlaspi arvense]